MPHDISTVIESNLELGHGSFLLDFKAARMAAVMRPAQFFMIGIPGSEALLRRPFSVCGLPGTFDDGSADGLQVLVKVSGKGTALLSALRAGAPITVLGPLGNGFTPPSGPEVRPLVVAGGIGCAPFPALMADLRGRARRPMMFYGAATRYDLPLLNWFRDQTADTIVTTDDGSLGRKGLVTEPLEEVLENSDPEGVKIYACGPQPMLKEVARISLARGIDCELSLEAHMACGFGACLGCVVPTRHASGEGIDYQRVCMEGPVMKPEVLAW